MEKILKRIDYRTEFEQELEDYIKEWENRTAEQVELDSGEAKRGFERFLKAIKYEKNINPKKMERDDFIKIKNCMEKAAFINNAVLDFAVDDRTSRGEIKLKCNVFSMSKSPCIEFASLIIDLENFCITYDKENQLVCLSVGIGKIDVKEIESCFNHCGK